MDEMTDDQKLQEIISNLTFLQLHIQNNVKASFTNLTFDLESLIRNFLNVFEKGRAKYINVDSIKHNYPAIDLFSDKKSVAIQVTTNADAAKVKKTIDTYARHKLTYKELVVIGFIKHSAKKFSEVRVEGIDYLINLAKHADGEQKDKIYEILGRSIPLNILHPLKDEFAFDVVFDVINRSAVRDMTEMEGSFERMLNALNEIKEIITTGVVSGKSIRAKALVEYRPAIKQQLSIIEFEVSRIIQITNKAKNRNKGGPILLSPDERDEIDNLKRSIISRTNKAAKMMGLTKQII